MFAGTKIIYNFVAINLYSVVYIMNLLRNLILSCSAAAAVSGFAATDFDKNFNDSTLRLDLVFAGNDTQSAVFLRDQGRMPGWYGRRANLDKVPYTGNGEVTVCDAATGDTIYRHTFSTLFTEWQGTDEAHETSKSFEHTTLVPMPKRESKITVRLMDNRHQTVGQNTHIYRPGDILVREYPSEGKAPYSYVHKGGDPKDVIDVAILAEGYRADEMEQFRAEAKRAVDAIFSHEPFKSRKADFNFIAVESPSEDSDVSVPRNHDWRRTAFNSNFDTFYSARYLTSGNVYDINNALTHVPYEHIIVLVKCPVYGGGGIYNSYTLTTTGHENFEPVVVHEFGHSFGGLADEYFYEQDALDQTYTPEVEPWEPNITTLVDFDSKWKGELKEGTPVPTPIELKDKYPIGVYEGGGYKFHGIYRPADRCRMRDNRWPGFCPACQSALTRLIDFYVEK